ncbi:hypothetical protein K504DRAFT_501693 [Pleomassaria siparia CBS 279.74]|uniref:Uncharacterized protein n=1 Tax=Pleomassaria siparia CBS 279.74 TaxID=1314801 RepID=A0A6G1KC89_9PLEO|nr:hypothetical protein K504DRAFT_501693 [Pleomassaria siparia CBS 279.74]
MAVPNGNTGIPDLAQAFKDLERGEQTADAMEKHLSAVERKINQLLAKAEQDEQSLKTKPVQSTDSSSSTEEKDTA